MKTKVSSVIIMILMFVISTVNVFAMENSQENSDEDILKEHKRVIEKFCKNGVSYLKVEKDLELRILEYEEADLQYSNYVNNYDIFDSKSEYCLQRNIMKFYKDHGHNYVDEIQRKEKNKFITKYLSISTYEKEKEYYEELLKYKKEELKSLKSKYNNGYITKSEVIKQELANEEVSLILDKTKRKISNLKLDIKSKIGEEVKSIGLDEKISLKTKDSYLKEFEHKNTYIKICENKKEAYNIYLNELDKNSDLYNIKKNKAEKNIELLNLDILEYRRNIEIKIKEYIDSYTEAEEQQKNINKKIKYYEDLYNNSKKLYPKGRIRKLDIRRIETELCRLEYEKQVILFNKNVIFYNLYYQIE